jgi:hypothetical protein
MSPTTQSPTVRAFAASLLLGVAVLLVPGGARAQSTSPERALLNATAVAPSQAPAVTPAATRAIDGEAALLGRSVGHANEGQAMAMIEERSPVDGARALLGRTRLQRKGS